MDVVAATSLAVSGKLVKILVHTNVTRYLDFKQIDGCFVYKSNGTYVGLTGTLQLLCVCESVCVPAQARASGGLTRALCLLCVRPHAPPPPLPPPPPPGAAWTRCPRLARRL
jgi:hypothetical protein